MPVDMAPVSGKTPRRGELSSSAPDDADDGRRSRARDLWPGAVVQLRDGSFGVVLSPRNRGRGGRGVPVDLWDAPPALVPLDEVVHVVDDATAEHVAAFRS
jgi:hypothetical protein